MGKFDRTAVFVAFDGKKRSGKNTTLRRCLNEQAERYPNRKFIILDEMEQIASWEIQEVPGNRPLVYHEAAHPGLKKSGSIPYSNTLIYTTRAEFEQMPGAMPYYQFHCIQTDDIPLRDIIKMCMQLGGMNLVVDEIDMYLAKDNKCEYAEQLIQRAAHFGTSGVRRYVDNPESVGVWGSGCSLLYTYRRQAAIETDLLGGTDTWFLTQATYAEDNKRIAREVKTDWRELHERRSVLTPPDCIRFDNGVEITEEKYIIDVLSDPKEPD